MGESFKAPRNGSHNDKAHPPIHPVNYVVLDSLMPNERKVLEFVVRRFLACCSEDAKGVRSEVEIEYGSETFKASGLTVHETNYLNVYPYEKWTSTEELPPFVVGEAFEPDEANIADGKTSRPSYLTEPELIGLMDANGIGTDATMAEHISKIQDRQYIQKMDGPTNNGHQATRGRGSTRGGRGRGRGRNSADNSGRDDQPTTSNNRINTFIPTTLGVALYEGYEKMGLETSLTRPFLRKEVRVSRKPM